MMSNISKKLSDLHGANAFLIAAIAFVSLQPYFFWGMERPISAVLLIGSVLISVINYFKTKNEFLFTFRKKAVLLTAFFLLAYMSILPTSAGEYKRWIYLYPYVVVVVLLSEKYLKKSVKIFSYLFLLSLFPQLIFLFLQLFFHIPISWDIVESFDSVKELGGIFYFSDGVSIYLNTVTFPLDFGQYHYVVDRELSHLKIWTRLTGVYSEPGLIGTMCMLFCLVGLPKIKYFIHIFFGFLSVSLAFLVLYPILIIKDISRKKVIGHIFVCVMTLFLVMGLSMSGGYGFLRAMLFQRLHVADITDSIYEMSLKKNKDSSKKNKDSSIEEFEGFKNTKVVFNNSARESIEFKMLLKKYWDSNFQTLLFGISSDANGQYGGDNFSWRLYFTNYGLVGVFLIFLFMLALLAAERRINFEFLLEVMAIVLLVSQRPFFWMPSFFVLIYFIGLEIRDKSSSTFWS